jgi:hypothetical protein
MGTLRTVRLGLEAHYVASFERSPEVIILDIDTTDDPTHGQQQLTFFHGYYDHHSYHPLMIFDGESGQLVTALLRPGNSHAARGALGVLWRLISPGTDLARPIYYVAGPPQMVTGLRTILNKAGINDDDSRTEEFTGY